MNGSVSRPAGKLDAPTTSESAATAESLMAASATAAAQSINKFTQALKADNKFQRKTALEQMRKQLTDSCQALRSIHTPPPAAVVIYSPDAIRTILKSAFALWSDPIEKCRELAVEMVSLVLEDSALTPSSSTPAWDADTTSLCIMSLWQRLGGKESKEAVFISRNKYNLKGNRLFLYFNKGNL